MCNQGYVFRFSLKNPDEAPGGFLSDCNPNSLQEMKSFADKSIKDCKVLQNFQFERVGFFTVDRDTTASEVVEKDFFLKQHDKIFKFNFFVSAGVQPYSVFEGGCGERVKL